MQMCSLNTFGVESQMGLIGLKSRCWPGFISSGDSGGDPCLFQLLEAACVPQLIVPFSNFKASSIASSNLSMSPASIVMRLSLTFHWPHLSDQGYSSHFKILKLITPTEPLFFFFFTT